MRLFLLITVTAITILRNQAVYVFPNTAGTNFTGLHCAINKEGNVKVFKTVDLRNLYNMRKHDDFKPIPYPMYFDQCDDLATEYFKIVANGLDWYPSEKLLPS